MISAIVIVASIVLAIAFTVMRTLAPGLREEVEAPKHWFCDQARRYDQHCQDAHRAPDENA